MRKTYFIVLILLIVVLCSCHEPNQESNNNWQDESILGEKIVGEEYEMILPLLQAASGEALMPDARNFSDLFSYYNYSDNKRIIEMTAIEYGDYISAYLSNETIKKIKENNNYYMSETSNVSMYFGCVDDVLFIFRAIKLAGELNGKMFENDNLILFKSEDNNLVYSNSDKRLVGIWQEIILKTNDGRSMKVLCELTGELKGNNYLVFGVNTQNKVNEGNINLGDKFWLKEDDYRLYISSYLYPVLLLEIDQFNGLDSVYVEHRIYKTTSSKEENVSNIEYYDYYNYFLEENCISKEYIKEWTSEVEYWGYWLDYSKVKEVLNVK